MGKRGNPNLDKQNDSRKEKTLNKIRNAYKELKSAGSPLEIKNLQEATGLSKGAFSLPHIKSLLIELRVGKYGRIRLDKEPDEISYDDFIQLTERIGTLEKQVENQQQQIKKLERNNKQLTEENSELRFEVFERELAQQLNVNLIPSNKT